MDLVGNLVLFITRSMGAVKWILPDGKNISGGLLDFTPFCVARKTEKKNYFCKVLLVIRKQIFGEWQNQVKFSFTSRKYKFHSHALGVVSAMIIWTN